MNKLTEINTFNSKMHFWWSASKEYLIKLLSIDTEQGLLKEMEKGCKIRSHPFPLHS